MGQNIVLLVGGVGGAKLAYGLAQIVPPENLTIVVNTGDDFWHYGLRICPDLDTITYTLSGLVNQATGWGVADDTTITLETLRRLGDDPWFTLGDKDLALHMLRTQLWQEGQTLTQITQRLTAALDIQCNILPMTDSPVATIVDTIEFGELPFQEYFVKHRWQPTFRALRLKGIESARLSTELVQAMNDADFIIIGPSNPWLSINPILCVPGMRELIISREIPRVAVTPIVDGQAVKGPTAKIMRELGYSVSPEAVVEYYGEVINGFVFDERDGNLAAGPLRKTTFDTIMDSDLKRIALARNVLEWTIDWEQGK